MSTQINENTLIQMFIDLESDYSKTCLATIILS